MLEEFVGSLGYSARTESDASAALRAIAQRAPAVILLDIQMPGLQGVDALPAIRALAPGTAVIMVSGVHDADIAKQALSRGAFDYVVKPPDLTYLAQSLQAAVAAGALDG
jgi:DNA-binding NtrC family response regulator